MRIGYIIGTLALGGTEIHLAELLPVLKARGHEVSILVIGPMGPFADMLTREDVTIYPPEPLRVPTRFPVWLRWIVRAALLPPLLCWFALRHRNGILHIFHPESRCLCVPLLLPWRRRLVVSQRSLLTYRTRYPRLVTHLDRFAFRQSTLVLANSRRVAEELTDDGVDIAKMSVIYNGLSAKRLNPRDSSRSVARAGLDIGADTLVMMVVANLHHYKGHADLLEALAVLKGQGVLGPNWMLLCVGRDIAVDGRELTPHNSRCAALNARSSALGLSGHVVFLGERHDVPFLLPAADVGVLPSHEEGFSNALIEKMAAGLAIVATDVGGNAEALDHGGAGLLVPAGDVKRLAQALATVVCDRNLRRRLGAAAKERALAEYGIAQCAAAYEDAYATVIRR